MSVKNWDLVAILIPVKIVNNPVLSLNISRFLRYSSVFSQTCFLTYPLLILALSHFLLVLFKGRMTKGEKWI